MLAPEAMFQGQKAPRPFWDGAPRRTTLKDFTALSQAP